MKIGIETKESGMLSKGERVGGGNGQQTVKMLHGTYERVIYGRTVEFKRNPDNSSEGVFVENFTTRRIPFKMRSEQLYTEYERLLIGSMIVFQARRPTPIDVSRTTSSLVLDKRGNVMLVTNP
jgi:hypothetical protein